MISTRPPQHHGLHLVEIYATLLVHSHLDELMYDDYDLDYTCYNDHSYDLDDEFALDSQDLDEEYARDAQDYESLAYRHYA